jgi:hypothetical protein
VVVMGLLVGSGIAGLSCASIWDAFPGRDIVSTRRGSAQVGLRLAALRWAMDDEGGWNATFGNVT